MNYQKRNFLKKMIKLIFILIFPLNLKNLKKKNNNKFIWFLNKNDK